MFNLIARRQLWIYPKYLVPPVIELLVCLRSSGGRYVTIMDSAATSVPVAMTRLATIVMVGPVVPKTTLLCF